MFLMEKNIQNWGHLFGGTLSIGCGCFSAVKLFLKWATAGTREAGEGGIWKGPFCVLTASPPPSGFQHRKQTRLDKAHPGGDPGEDHPPEGRPEGAHPHPENSPGCKTEGQEVSVVGGG